MRVDSGKIRIDLELVSGDIGRPVVLNLTPHQFESFTKAGQQAIEQDRVAQVRREEWKAKMEMKMESFRKSQRIEQLERQVKELQAQIDGVHDLVHPNRSQDTVPAAAPARFQDTLPGAAPTVPPRPSGVTH